MNASPRLLILFILLVPLGLPCTDSIGYEGCGREIPEYVHGKELPRQGTAGNCSEKIHPQDYKPTRANTDPYTPNVTNTSPPPSLGTIVGNTGPYMSDYKPPGPNTDPCNTTCPPPSPRTTDKAIIDGKP